MLRGRPQKDRCQNCGRRSRQNPLPKAYSPARVGGAQKPVEGRGEREKTDIEQAIVDIRLGDQVLNMCIAARLAHQHFPDLTVRGWSARPVDLHGKGTQVRKYTYPLEQEGELTEMLLGRLARGSYRCRINAQASDEQEVMPVWGFALTLGLAVRFIRELKCVHLDTADVNLVRSTPDEGMCCLIHLVGLIAAIKSV